MRYTLIALTLFLSTLSTVAMAADKVDWTPCNAEIEKFCKGVHEKDGEEALYQCLLKHDIDLSKTCDNGAHSKYEKATGKQ
jgi:hypothetical protein